MAHRIPGYGHLSPSTVLFDGPFSHSMLHVRGIRLHAAQAGKPTDPLILLLHSGFGGWWDYQEVIAPLAEAGFHVAAIDLRGYGASDKPPHVAGGFTYDVRTVAGDITGIIRSLGHSSATLVGADVGGAVAWCVAGAYPEVVDKLVSVSAAHPQDLRRIVFRRPWLSPGTVVRHWVSRVRWLAPRLVSERAYQTATRVATASSFHTTAACEETIATRIRAGGISGVRAHSPRIHRLLTGIVPLKWQRDVVSCPVLYIHPRTGLWRTVAKHASRRTSGPTTVTSIPGAQDLPMLEDPAGFVSTVLGWLD
ncbi:alpha/beta fold hydrolase [Corynebacterium renale]|uniref:alpha/beta fold hydrolase n=1 Tax=Corynebacterium renale TaxID=1724 RepID=UPI000DBE484C|nr:alpha/beta hydrolase [Corynebacterium renale]